MHRDPVFYEVARREAKSCRLCMWKARVWGLDYCTKDERKAGDNMKRCKDYRQERVRDDRSA